MTDRDMSYELDSAFASRNDGEMQTFAPAKTRLMRSGGIQVMQPNDLDSDSVHAALAVPDQTSLIDSGPTRDLVSGPVRKAGGLADLSIDLPIIGSVNLLHVGIAVGATLLICKMMKKNG